MNRSVLANHWPRLISAVLLLAMILAPAAPTLAETESPFTVKFSGVIDVVPASGAIPGR